MKRTARAVGMICAMGLSMSAFAGVDLQSFVVDPAPAPEPIPSPPSTSAFAALGTGDLPTHDATVGTLAGQAGTDGGAATYQVPIVVPPGRAGMQPSLALNYNSRSGDGIAGLGWTLSGQSSIHRCPQTPEQDGNTAGVNYTASDRLCLDGQRLVSVSGSYGQSGAEYRTEVDSYARIFQVGGDVQTNGTGTCFRVEQKEGRILHYGGVIGGSVGHLTCAQTGAGSQVQPLVNGTAQKTLSWLIEKIEDRVGNNQLYAYTNVAGSSGEVLLHAVTYTGYTPTSAVGNRTVTFAYELRANAASGATDLASSYLAGSLTLQTQALQSITTAVAGTPVRTYTPTYHVAQYSGRLLMTALQECAGATCHPATLFTYNDDVLNTAGNFPFVALNAAAIPLGSTDQSQSPPLQLYSLGDLDGDGTRESGVLTADNNMFLVQATGDRVIHAAVNLTGTGFDIHPTSFADIDGDGRAKLIKTAPTGGKLTFGVWNLGRGTPIPSGATYSTLFTDIASNIPFVGGDTFYTGDFNGDGKLDVVRVMLNSGSPCAVGYKGVYIYLNAMTGPLGSAGNTPAMFTAPATPAFCLAVSGSGNSFTAQGIDHIGDFNGDGLPDFYLRTGTALGTTHFDGIYRTQPNGTSSSFEACGAALGLIADPTPNSTTDVCTWAQPGAQSNFVTFMDVNGDGLEDIVLARPNQRTWRVIPNTGGSYGSEIATGSGEGLDLINSSSSKAFRYAGRLPMTDVDSDGKLDLLVPSNTQGFRGFALKMCTVTVIISNNTEGCPLPNGAAQAPIGNPAATSQRCPLYSCPEDPTGPSNPTGSLNMQAATTSPAGYNYQWNGTPAYGTYAGNGGPVPGLDNSLYHLSMLKFVQTGAAQFSVQRLETPLVGRLSGVGGLAGRSEGLFGDGLADLTTGVGCTHNLIAWGNGAHINQCSTVADNTYGPGTGYNLPDGTPTCGTTNADGSCYFDENAVLYAGINQGVVGYGGSPVTPLASSLHVIPATLALSSPSTPLTSRPYLPGLLDSATNGDGDFASWDYYPLSIPVSNAGVPLYTVPSTNGYVDSRHYYFQSSMPVVNGMAQNAGNGDIYGFRSAYYGYSEAMYNHFGRGFQGFRTITTNSVVHPADTTRQLRTTTTYSQKFPLTGKVIEVDTSAPDTGIVVAKETDTWRCTRTNRNALCPGDNQTALPVPTGTTVYRPFLDTQSVRNFDLATGTQTSHVDTVNAASAAATTSGWDNTACDTGVGTSTVFGNLNNQLVTGVDDASGGVFVSGHTTTTTNCYDLSGTGNWWINELAHSTVTGAVVYAGGHALPSGAAAPAQTLVTGYTWNSDRTPLTKTVQSGVANQQSTTTWTYPATSYGLPMQVAVNAPDLTMTLSPTRTTAYTYTTNGTTAAADGYFSFTTTNGLHQTTTTAVDPRDGQVTKLTDPNGVRVVTTYDVFGRATQIDYLDNTNPGVAFASSIQTAYTSCRDTLGATGHCLASLVGEDAYENNATYRVTTVQSGYPTQVTWLDPLHRSIKQAETGFSGAFIASLTDYNLSGTVSLRSTPYFAGISTPFLTKWTYDALNRPTQKIVDVSELNADPVNLHKLQTDYTYTGRQTAITVHDSQVALLSGNACPLTTINLCLEMTRSTNGLGQLMQTTESPILAGVRTLQTTNTWTDPHGHVVAIQDPELKLTTASYNALGQRTASNDPDQHAWTFGYDALGELLTQTDARGVTTTINTRDALGRTTEQQQVPPTGTIAGLDPNLVIDDWSYDPANGIGEPGTVTRYRGTSRTAPLTTNNPQAWRESYGYEATTARPSTITTTINEGGVAKTLASSMDYDSDGRANTHTYPSGLVVKKGYTAAGQLSALSDNTTSVNYWTATAQNEWGHVTGETFLGTLTGTHQDYHSTGQSYQLKWGAPANDTFTYGYDAFGNLTRQSRSATGATNAETYLYDPLQRLTRASRNVGAAVNYGYTASGNLTSKSDYSTATAGAYAYGSNGCGPHAASSVALSPANGGGSATYVCDQNGNVIDGNVLKETFDADNHPTTVTRTFTGVSTPPCHRSDTVFCDGFEVLPPHTTTGATNWTYAATGERDTEQTSQGTRVYGPGGYELFNAVAKHELGPVVVSRVGTTDTVSVVLRDRLGSTLDTVDGNTPARLAYDAFGKARNGDFSDRTNGTLNLADTTHGFTDHTHADDVALIHMNGRIYDYQLGRFLSVDPIIQNPANSQSLNPYSYLGNNPLSGTDPTGYDCQAESSGNVTSTCLMSNDGINKVTDASGKAVATVIVASKGDNITISGNGGSSSSTFTGKAGDISRVLNGPPSEIGAISKLTNSTLEGTAATYGIGADKTRSPYTDVMAQEQQGRQRAEWEIDRQYTFAHEAIEGVPILGVEAVGQAAYGAYNEIKQSGGVSAATIGGIVATVGAGMLHVPGANDLPALRQAYVGEVQMLEDFGLNAMAAGQSKEATARMLHQMRRDLGETYKNQTPAGKLNEIHSRNLQKYGDKLGPSVEWLRDHGKTWDQIIDSASRSGGKDLDFKP